MLPAAPAPVVEDDDPGTFLQVVAAIGPKVGSFGFPVARV